jgi:hypothetical protein
MARTCGRTSEERIMKIVFENALQGKMSVGKPRKIWLNDVEII